jgi:DNA-binding SARP family transcriptional activator
MRTPVNKPCALVLLGAELPSKFPGSQRLEGDQRTHQPREDGQDDQRGDRHRHGDQRAAEDRNHHYCLSPKLRLRTDTAEFDALYGEGRRLEKMLGMSGSVMYYETAIELYRGDYLVEDLYEDWTMFERERLISAYLDMLDRLAKYYRDSGRYHDSIQACYRLLQKDPCFESAYRLSMECYAQLGLITRASEQYRMCEHVLGLRHGMEPSEETRHAFRSMARVT